MRSQVARIRSLSAFAAGISYAVLAIATSGDGLVVTAKVGATDVVADMVDVCDDAGKVKVFKNIDDFIKVCSKMSAFSATGVTLRFSNAIALDPKPFTGDYVAKNRASVAAYTANKAVLMATSAGYATQLTLMPSLTAAEIAMKSEKQAQKDAVDAQIAWLGSEVTRIAALLPAA